MDEITVDLKMIEDVFDRYADMLLRIAFQNTKNQADAEDIVQDVFLRLQKQRSFKDDTHIKAWLIRVTINLCKNFAKSAWIRKTAPLIGESWEPLSPEQSEVFDRLWSLPQKYRNVIYLYYYEGYTVPEIAVMTGINVNTVSSRFSRGKKKLKDILIEGGYGNET